jgi:glycosyltransferase involved in cell wall biosynthesis
MKLSIVIATYRRAQSLGKTLATIAAQHRLPDEVIVVDQSPDEERAAVREAIEKAALAGLGVRLIWSETPSSTHARNLGLDAASGDWIVFSDDDVDWPAGVMASLSEKIESNPNVALVAARDLCLPQTRRPFWQKLVAAIFMVDSWGCLRRGRVFESMQARYPQPIIGDMETEWAMGYWFAVDRRLVLRHRLVFDEKMSRYAQAEDMLFSHQFYMAALREGRTCIVSEGLAVSHLVSQEWREPTAFSDLCSVWNRIYVASRLRSGAGFWLSIAAIYWAMWHQVAVRIMSGRSYGLFIMAHLIALANLSAIRAGEFSELYQRHESQTP